MAATAGLSALSAKVSVGPPLLPIASSIGSVLFTLPVAVKLHDASSAIL
jgi:hypothetical protein